MGQTEIEDSVHPATDVELLSHRYSFLAFVPFCLPSSLIRKSLRAANGGNCELVAHWNPRPTSLATVFFFSFHLFFWFFAISSFCSRIPCHISIRYTCIKEPVDFRNKNTETPHSAWLKSRVEIFAEATLHASQKIVSSSSSSAFDESSSFNLFIGDRKHEASIKER